MLGPPDFLEIAFSSKPTPTVKQGMVKTILESGFIVRRGKNNYGKKVKKNGENG